MEETDGDRIDHFHKSKLTEKGMDKSGGLSIQNLDRFIFKLRRIICLARIIQRITRQRWMIRL